MTCFKVPLVPIVDLRRRTMGDIYECHGINDAAFTRYYRPDVFPDIQFAV